MARVKFPRSYKKRLKATGKANGFKGADDFAEHLLVKGAASYDFIDRQAPLRAQLEEVMDEQGYSSVDEVIEHLLERGLDAYGGDRSDGKSFEERLRGLGYIE